jgi:hypothetical protein
MFGKSLITSNIVNLDSTLNSASLTSVPQSTTPWILLDLHSSLEEVSILSRGHGGAFLQHANVYQGSGIGRATAVGLAKEGAAGILIADINISAAKDVTAECKEVATAPGFRAEAIHIDVTKEDSVEQATSFMVETFGRIDYCVTCAGVSHFSVNCGYLYPIISYSPCLG